MDEDIEALDERTEDNRKDCDHILDSLKVLEDRVASNSSSTAAVGPSASGLRQEIEAGLRQEIHTGLRKEIEAGLRKELHSDLRKEVEAAIAGKDLASKPDLARGLKTIPFGLSKEEVSQMIEFATRNFLRTVQGIHC